MPVKELKTFKVRDYKCFSKENDYQGFDEIKPINIIIGKNNSGKSKILEFLGAFVNKTSKERDLKIFDNDCLIGKSLSHAEIKSTFPENQYGGPYSPLLRSNTGSNWHDIGMHLEGRNILTNGKNSVITDHDFDLSTKAKDAIFDQATKAIADHLFNPFYGYTFLSIQAERDVKKESVNFSGNLPLIAFDGSRLTEVIVRCLQEEQGHSQGWQRLIEKELLDNINSVLAPDLKFTRINNKSGAGLWEIYLEEEHKGSVKLSDCGSGIKTVILVMAMLHLVPKLKHLIPHPNDPNKIIYSFEELENNLHPALERKLLAHIRNHILKTPDSLLFLTTHSSIVIDLFSNNPNAQIVRAYNDGKASYIEKVDTWKKHHNLLDELGVKASDVLQTNCVVWLEGPSDRIYFKKWLELFNSEKALEEGLHYQCVFYGGSVLAQHTLGSDDELIQMLRVNRNAIILMDSDKSSPETPLKSRVQKIINESDESGALTWVTEGREIENYLPNSILSKYFSNSSIMKKYDHFDRKYKTEKNVESFDKVDFAIKITSAEYYNKSEIENHLDLQERMISVIEYIQKCNS